MHSHLYYDKLKFRPLELKFIFVKICEQHIKQNMQQQNMQSILSTNEKRECTAANHIAEIVHYHKMWLTNKNLLSWIFAYAYIGFRCWDQCGQILRKMHKTLVVYIYCAYDTCLWKTALQQRLVLSTMPMDNSHGNRMR